MQGRKRAHEFLSLLFMTTGIIEPRKDQRFFSADYARDEAVLHAVDFAGEEIVFAGKNTLYT